MASDLNVSVEYMNKTWWDIVECPNKITCQHFGFEVDIDEKTDNTFVDPKEGRIEIDTGYSNVTNDEEVFKIEFALGPFNNEEVRIKNTDNCVTLCFHQQTKSEGLGRVSRKMERTYVLPPECDVNTIKGSVSSDILTITCMKTQNKDRERLIELSAAEIVDEK